MIFLIWLLKSILVIGIGFILPFIISALSLTLIDSSGLMWGLREKTQNIVGGILAGSTILLSVFFVIWFFPSLSEDEMKAACTQELERRFEYDFEWTDGWTNNWHSKTQNWALANNQFIKLEANAPSDRIFFKSYIGDRLRLQNKYGAWSNYIYECDYRSKVHRVKFYHWSIGSVMDVRLKRGKF